MYHFDDLYDLVVYVKLMWHWVGEVNNVGYALIIGMQDNMS